MKAVGWITENRLKNVKAAHYLANKTIDDIFMKLTGQLFYIHDYYHRTLRKLRIIVPISSKDVKLSK